MPWGIDPAARCIIAAEAPVSRRYSRAIVVSSPSPASLTSAHSPSHRHLGSPVVHRCYCISTGWYASYGRSRTLCKRYSCPFRGAAGGAQGMQRLAPLAGRLEVDGQAAGPILDQGDAVDVVSGLGAHPALEHVSQHGLGTA